MSEAAAARVRALCLALPEATERETWGSPTFRVRDKIFATVDETATQLCCKAPPGVQAVLVNAAPDRFFVPHYVGHKGWVGIVLDDQTNWNEVADLIRRSYRLIAPRALARS